jgi:hypothetical protein
MFTRENNTHDTESKTNFISRLPLYRKLNVPSHLQQHLPFHQNCHLPKLNFSIQHKISSALDLKLSSCFYGLVIFNRLSGCRVSRDSGGVKENYKYSGTSTSRTSREIKKYSSYRNTFFLLAFQLNLHQVCVL